MGIWNYLVGEDRVTVKHAVFATFMFLKSLLSVTPDLGVTLNQLHVSEGKNRCRGYNGLISLSVFMES